MSFCRIQLDNYQPQYAAGNTIVGRVICNFNSSKNIRGIEVRLKGEERNRWSKSESYYDSHEKRHKHRTVHYSGHNQFLYLSNTLQGGGDVGPGSFEYPFSFHLPVNLPSTYRGDYGGISFALEAKVDRPFKFDFTDSKELVVVSPINLNLMRGQLQLEPVSYSDEKSVCCWCCTSGNITMDVHLEKEAFAPGEVAQVRVDVTNMSNSNVDSVYAKMFMSIKSMVTHPRSDYKMSKELVAADRGSGVGAHGQNTYNFQLDIPQSTPVPNFALCTLFSSRYKLKVNADVSGCHTDLEINIPFTMGNIPAHSLTGNNSASYTSVVPPYIPEPYPPLNTAYPPPLPNGALGFVSSQQAPPYPADGPSAPPPEGGASAPSKKEIAQGDVGLTGGFGTSEPPPPSYDDAVWLSKQ